MSDSPPPAAPRAARLAVEALEDRTTPVFAANPLGTLNVNGLNVPTGGLSIAAGNLLPDVGGPPGQVRNEYVTGTGPGHEALVRVWSLDGNTLLSAFDPFPGFTGGINVAVGDVTGDRTPEIVVAVAANGPPHVKVFDAGGTLLGSFYAFTPLYSGGLNIAVGNVLGGIGAGGFSGGTTSGNFKQEIIIGTATGTSHVVVTDASGTYLRSFLAFAPTYTGGVTVAAANVDKTRAVTYFPPAVFPPANRPDTNAYDEIVVGAASVAPHVEVFSVWNSAATLLSSFYAFNSNAGRGVNVAAGSTDGTTGANIYANLLGTSTISVFDGATSALIGTRPNIYPAAYTGGVLNMTVANLKAPPLGTGFYNPADDNASPFGTNLDFLLQDLAVVTGDGPFEQQPRLLVGRLGVSAPLNLP